LTGEDKGGGDIIHRLESLYYINVVASDREERSNLKGVDINFL
jgi:hypothetical protein